MKAMYTQYALFAFLLLLALPAQAQHDLTRQPGYLDLQSIEGWFDTEPTLEVNVKGALLKLVAEASRREDPELADLLHKLQAVQVRGFSPRSAQLGDVERRVSELSRQLEQRGWDTVARVREHDEQVSMFVRTDGDLLAGLVVMVVSPGENETVFVNIVGEIDPMQIGRIGRKFDIDVLDDDLVRHGP